MHNRWIKFAVLLSGWAFLGLVLSLEVYFNQRVNVREAADFLESAIPQFGRVLMWAALAPLVLQLRHKVPLSRGHWLGGIGFHFAFSFVVMATYYLGRILAFTFFWDEPLASFWATAQKAFYGRNIIDMAFYWAVLAFGYSFEIYQKYKSEELKAAQLEARLVETELKALREQLRPHFLFNTLNTVAVLVREQKTDEAVNLIARLSALLRMSLDPSRTHEVTLRQEMEFLERYIEIQQARFSDRLRVNIAVEAAAMDARIPHLILQPIVENAILHGIAPKTGPGQVDVFGRVAQGRLHLEVRDDGPGFPTTARGREGIGLSNTRERLAKIYGAASQSSFKSEPGAGVTVQIVIPCRT